MVTFEDTPNARTTTEEGGVEISLFKAPTDI